MAAITSAGSSEVPGVAGGGLSEWPGARAEGGQAKIAMVDADSAAAHNGAVESVLCRNGPHHAAHLAPADRNCPAGAHLACDMHKSVIPSTEDQYSANISFIERADYPENARRPWPL